MQFRSSTSVRNGTAAIVASLLWTSCDARPKGSAGEPALVEFEEVFNLSHVVSLETAPSDPMGNPVDLVEWVDRIAIVDAMQKNVKVFDERGRLLSTMGRPGDGPGEFRRPFDAIVLDDGRLAVADKMHTRVSMFAQDGTHQGSWIYAFGPTGSAIGIEGGRAVLVSVRRTSGAMGGSNLYVHESNGELRQTIEVADCLPDPRAISAGMPMVAVLGDNVFVVEPTLSRVRVVGLHDKAQRTLDLSLPAAIWEEWDWSQSPERQDEGLQWMREQTWIRQPLGDGSHEFILPVSKWAPGPDGEARTSYVRITGGGTVASATLPSPRWITSIVGDTAYGAEITEDGESVLYVYHVTWPESK